MQQTEQWQPELDPHTQWNAGQGDPVAQRAVAEHYRGIGDFQRAHFWDAKASGDPSFSFENWVSKQAVRAS